MVRESVDVVFCREYPGGRPFAEPGMSISNVGPCGMETYDSLMVRIRLS